MARHYPIVFEREGSGVVSAYVAGLPVYAQGPTRGKLTLVAESPYSAGASTVIGQSVALQALPVRP